MRGDRVLARLSCSSILVRCGDFDEEAVGAVAVWEGRMPADADGTWFLC